MLRKKSQKLENVCYDIRGENLLLAQRMQEEGHKIYHLHTGNTYPFGFTAPEEIIQDVLHNLPTSQGYINSKGLYSARKAIMQECQLLNIRDVGIEDIYLGNGVSELINMALQALLDTQDEVLIPSPDYPLWTACTTLSGGTPIHYRCDEDNDWLPNLDDIRSKISKRTKALLIITPNNPTGSVYPESHLREMLQIAREHGLLVFADEIYQKITFHDTPAKPVASLCSDLFIITFNGLSKAYRLPGFRAGWMILSGNKHFAKDYIEGLDILSNMRLCSNVPVQHAIQTALGGHQSVRDLTQPSERLHQQLEYSYERLRNIPGVSCVKPKGALYLFPRFDTEYFPFQSDEIFVRDLLLEKKILLVQGTGFNYSTPDHVRMTFLPHLYDLEIIFDALEEFLLSYRQI